jgi:poly(3-hydroxybutyrate) depolymerase
MIRVFALVGALAFGASAALADGIDINGLTRTFAAQLPGTRPAPLVIVLHGNTQTGAAAPAASRLQASGRPRARLLTGDAPTAAKHRMLM